MAQALDLTLAHIASQVQASSKDPKKLFLGKDFAHVGVGGRVPYQQLIETIQTCIHKAQDKGEKNYKGLAEKTIRQLKKIAPVQRIASPENIDLITKVAIEALKPNEIFQATAKMKSNPIIEKGIFQKVLSLLIFVREELIIDEEQTRSKKDETLAVEARQSALPQVAAVKVEKGTIFYHNIPESLSSIGLAFYFRWIKTIFTHNGITTPHIDLSENNLDELRQFLNNGNLEVRKLAQDFIKFIENDRIIGNRRDKINQSIQVLEALRKKSDILTEENQSFMDEHNPTREGINTLQKVDLQAPMLEKEYFLKKNKIFDQMPEYEGINRFVYRYFYNELARLLKPGEKLIGKYFSIIREHDYILPTPEKFETFCTDKEVERPQLEEKQPLAAKQKASKKKQRLKEAASAAAVPAMAPTLVAESVAAPQAAAAPSSDAVPAAKPQDDLAAILAKKEFPVKEVVYSDRVLKAFESVEKPSHDVDSIWRHTFPEELDQFLGTAYSQKRDWINQTTGHRDTLYVMPGEVEVSKGEWKRCQFEWCIGADGKCYHRFCSYKEKNTLIESWMSGTALTDENFPTLQQSYKDATWKAKPKDKKGEKIKIELDPVWNYITLTDAKTNISCKIFKIGR